MNGARRRTATPAAASPAARRLALISREGELNVLEEDHSDLCELDDGDWFVLQP
jgi:hypothetical protein